MLGEAVAGVAGGAGGAGGGGCCGRHSSLQVSSLSASRMFVKNDVSAFSITAATNSPTIQYYILLIL